ncbi:MAG TPA: isoprenylcysteine carboxylmethyltransferase family protein [Azospirillaceae bacterium]|nr:isoprenylcysteine carboxylmethyltransferase family protein [Azospirillaceae bacterium]
MELGVPHIILALVALQRLGELVYANMNTKALLARGAVEIGARHYPLFVLLHGGWLITLFLAVPADAPIVWPLVWLFLLLQLGRVWVVATLGPYWTTRIITLPGAPLVRRGPFRFVRHPNYLVVTGEIAVLPLAFGAWEIALVFSVLNALLLRHRIRVEEGALEERRPLPAAG